MFPAYAMPLMVAEVSQRVKGQSKVASSLAHSKCSVNCRSNKLQIVNGFIEANQTGLLEDGRNIARSFYSRTFALRTCNFSFDQYGTIAGMEAILGQYDEAGNLTVRFADSFSIGSY